MAVQDIEANEWDSKVTNSKQLVAVEFWHEQCKWCVKFAPVYEAVSGKNPEIGFLKLNILSSEENNDLAVSKGAMSTPTIKFFCNGVEVSELVGYRDESEFDQVIDDLKAKAGKCIDQSTRIKE